MIAANAPAWMIVTRPDRSPRSAVIARLSLAFGETGAPWDVECDTECDHDTCTALAVFDQAPGAAPAPVPAHLIMTWDDLNAAVCHAPARIVEDVATGVRRSYRDTGEAVAALVARRLGIALTVQRPTGEVVEYPAIADADTL